jgi:hypothetical protein
MSVTKSCNKRAILSGKWNYARGLIHKCQGGDSSLAPLRRLNMGSGYSKMKKQAKLMEQQLETMRGELKAKSFTGSSGNGLVTLTLNGEKELLSLKIKPECVDLSDLEGLEDLIKAAYKEAAKQVSDDPMNNMQAPGGMSLPFF